MSLYSRTEDSRCAITMFNPNTPRGPYVITVSDKESGQTLCATEATCLLYARQVYQSLVHRWAPGAVA